MPMPKKWQQFCGWLFFYAYVALCLYLLIQRIMNTEHLIEKNVDLDYLHGISLWLANLYDSERLLFGVVVTLSMAIIGISVAIFTDFLLYLAGLEVDRIKRIE
jgi:hypothetical protein